MKNQSPSKMSAASNSSNVAAWSTMLLCALTLLIFTLKPFQFIYPPRSWDFDFYPRDLFQNVVLFLPLGVLLRRSLSLNFKMVILLGFLFSLGIECIQLFTPHRFSNPYDIACNTGGSALGAWLADQIFCTKPNERTAEFIMTLLLLCWVIGLGINGEPISRYAVFPFSAIGAMLFYRRSAVEDMRRRLVLLTWSALSVAFFFYSISLHAVIYLTLVTTVNVLFCCLPIHPRRALVGLFSLGSALVLIALVLRLASFPWNWDTIPRFMELVLPANILNLSRALQV
jgi:glycopeptide antibiotics resistance protein